MYEVLSRFVRTVIFTRIWIASFDSVRAEVLSSLQKLTCPYSFFVYQQLLPTGRLFLLFLDVSKINTDK